MRVVVGVFHVAHDLDAEPDRIEGDVRDVD